MDQFIYESTYVQKSSLGTEFILKPRLKCYSGPCAASPLYDPEQTTEQQAGMIN